MISIENGLFFLLKRIQKLAPPPVTFLFLCKGMHVLKPARLQVYSFDTVRGDLVVWDRHYPDVTPTFLQHFFLFVGFLFLVGKEATTTTFLHLFFAFRLHQSSSPSSSNMHVFPWNLDSLEFACENAEVFFFYLLQAYLCFFHLSNLSQKLFLLHFLKPLLPLPSPPKKKRKKWEKKNRKRKRSKSMVHGGNESTTWLMLCPNPRQRKCSCSAKTQIWRLCSRKPKS